MIKKIGFIGSGNMAKAMIKGILLSKKFSKENVYVSNINEDSLLNIKKQFDVQIVNDNTILAKTCDIIFLCIKPYKYEYICSMINDYIDENKIIVSIAPGQTIDIVSSYFNKRVNVFSSMPNTPAKVLSGMSAVCHCDYATEDDKNLVLSIFKCFGEALFIDEALINAVIPVSGSSPAFIYILIEAMADQGVAFGLSRSDAIKFSANAVLGSAKMVLEDEDHVAKLKDNVCSPGGTTIAGVLELEKTGFRSSIQQAMKKTFDKANEM